MIDSRIVNSKSVELVVGATGLIGRALLTSLQSSGIAAVGTTRNPASPDDLLRLDLTRMPLQWEPPPGVSVAYLAAAVARLAACEEDPAGSRIVNVDGIVTVTKALLSAGSFVVFLSTNQVFDGQQAHMTENSPRCPRTEYGRQKTSAEEVLLTLDSRVAIVRLTKVVARNQGLFAGWRKSLERGDTIEAFNDMTLAPVSLDFAVRAIASIGRHRQGGLWQISGPEDLSYLDAARCFARQLGATESQVRAVTAVTRGIPETMLPKYTTLDTIRLRRELKLLPPTPCEVFEWLLGE